MLTYNIGPAVPASVTSLADFVQWCKAHPESATYATTAAGGTPHFVGVMLATAAGIAMTPVHYRGGAPALQDLIGGHVPAGVNPISETLSQARSGTLRILAVTGARRSPFLPDVPTMREQGYDVVVGGLARRFRAGRNAGRDRAHARRRHQRGRARRPTWRKAWPSSATSRCSRRRRNSPRRCGPISRAGDRS